MGNHSKDRTGIMLGKMLEMDVSLVHCIGGITLSFVLAGIVLSQRVFHRAEDNVAL
jgi:hypothetical protein